VEYQDRHTLDQLWPNYLQGGYFDDDGNLRIELVARARIGPLAKAMGRAQPRLTMYQVQRFLQHCRAIEARIRAKSSSWAAEQASFLYLDAAAADAAAKSPKRIPALFHDFIERNVAAVKTEKDFLEGFLPHFGALIGFGSRFFQDGEPLPAEPAAEPAEVETASRPSLRQNGGSLYW